MRLRRWESWIVYSVDGSRVPSRDRRLRFHLTRSGAERWAAAVALDPAVLEKRLEALERGHLILIDGEVRAAIGGRE